MAIFIGLGALMAMLLLGLPLGVTLLGVGYFGFAAVHPKGFDVAGLMTVQQVIYLATNFQFAVLPLFILMGAFISRSALSDDLFEVANKWLGHLRGGLAMAAIAATGGFSAVSGSSSATAATMAGVAYPSMKRYGYSDALSTGTIAAGGTMGILIPPSAAMIIYGILAEQDIAKLFMAGVVPGLMMVLAFIIAIGIVTTIWPAMGPAASRSSWRERFTSLGRIWGVLFLFFLVMGGLFFGVFTSGEAGGIGAVGALIFAFARRKMTWRIFWNSLIDAAATTAKIFAVAVGALVLNQFVNLSGLPELTVDFIRRYTDTPLEAVFLIVGIYIILGMFIDGFAMIFLTVPIFVPVVQAMGLDLIWWGVVLVMVVEIGLITPPVGLNVFIIKSMIPEVPLNTIFKGIVPFFVADLVLVALVVVFPSLAVWLPTVMYK